MREPFVTARCTSCQNQHVFNPFSIRIFPPECCPNYITHCCGPVSPFSLLLSPLSLPTAAINAISSMARMTLLEDLAMILLLWARACVATAVRVVTRLVRYVLQVQTGLLGHMTMGRLSGDVRAQMLIGKPRRVSPLLTVRLPLAQALFFSEISRDQ